jgi:hypothetical protein
MKKHINHLFSTVKDKHRSYPKFLVSVDEPQELPVHDAERETSRELESQMTTTQFGQKSHIRRYARYLRQRQA